jgi:hypothetical protein
VANTIRRLEIEQEGFARIGILQVHSKMYSETVQKFIVERVERSKMYSESVQNFVVERVERSKMYSEPFKIL